MCFETLSFFVASRTPCTHAPARSFAPLLPTCLFVCLFVCVCFCSVAFVWSAVCSVLVCFGLVCSPPSPFSSSFFLQIRDVGPEISKCYASAGGWRQTPKWQTHHCSPATQTLWEVRPAVPFRSGSPMDNIPPHIHSSP